MDNALIQNLVTVTPPTTEPVTLDEAKAHLRVEITDDDTMIGSLITAARLMVENITRRTLIYTTYELRMNRFPYVFPACYYPFYTLERLPNQLWGRIYLPKPPLYTVGSITYVDTTGTTQTLDASQYTVDAGGDLQGMITPAYGLLFPTCRYMVDSVRVTYTAGYGADETSVPELAKLAIKLLVGHYYRNREATSESSLADLPIGVKHVLGPLMYGSYT